MDLPAGLTKTQVRELLEQIKPGVIFDTPFESGCIAQSSPDIRGNFDGLDSDNVLCTFSINVGGMPIEVK